MTDMCPNEFEAMIQPDLDVIGRVSHQVRAGQTVSESDFRSLMGCMGNLTKTAEELASGGPRPLLDVLSLLGECFTQIKTWQLVPALPDGGE
jgi:hypothetical protein